MGSTSSESVKLRHYQFDREVALKVLPQGFTDDPDRLARFEREAKVLASLNHPNIGSTRLDISTDCGTDW